PATRSVNGLEYRLRIPLFWPGPFVWWNLVFAGFTLLLASRLDVWKKQPTLAAAPTLRARWTGALAVGLWKLWLVAGVDSMAQGADAWVYADAVLKPIWGQSYS